MTDDLRQKAKQLCYALIYGMGTKALSGLLSVTDEEAIEFTQTFYHTYPRLKEFVQNTVDKCKQDGFVTTLAGRRRYLPHINDKNSAIKRKYTFLFKYVNN